MNAVANWDCVTTSKHLNRWVIDERQAITTAARNRRWNDLLNALHSATWINSVHLDDPTFDTSLHDAARGGAPEYVVQKLLDLMAFKTMRNAKGQRPIDLAYAAKQTHLYQILEPTIRSDVNPADLGNIQRHFHILIHQRAVHLESSTYQSLRLPELEPLLETNIDQIWCSIPGMYGGFTYWLKQESNIPTLVTVSHIRIVENSEQRHEIDVNGIHLVANASRSTDGSSSKI